ncbi:MAG TPA: HAMP domain-containing sensor histidine kinase [Candidatus Sulfotelmatobacter sp.]|nr:HAMP domain-containing sensor histidine kinase [Candidatus Sulfotelmatobacter sp.]
MRLKAVRTWAFRVVVLYIGLFALSVLTLLGFIYVTTVGFIDRQINATITAEINGLSESYHEHGLSGLVQVIDERIAADRAGDSIYLLTDSDYQPVTGNLPRWPGDVERQGRWANFEIPAGERAGGGDGGPISVRAMSFLLSEGYHLLVGRNLRERQNFEELIEQSLVWSLIITVALGMLGGVIMSRDMRRRLEAINRTTLRIMHGDLHERIPVTGSDDEFDQLSVNLNNMLQQIDRLLLAMREVTDNVAHDLRSPLTRLKSRLEVALLTPKSSEQYRHAIEQTVQETDNILTTFNALLSIAQAEGGAARGDMEPLDMTMLCADVAELYEPVAEARHLTLTAALADSAPIKGNRHLLFQAIANLIDNAIKYSTPDGSITLSVNIAGDVVEVVVADCGPGIPEADRERVLQRFVRLEQSRTTPGNGLGLSLVTAVMTLHGGSLVLDDNQPGLKATLRLPLAAAAATAPARAA